MILGCLSFFLLLTVAYCIIATSRYEADASVVVTFNRQITGDPTADHGGASSELSAAGADEIINSYGMVLQSDTLAEEVIREIGPSVIYPGIFSPPTAFGRALDSIGEFFGVHKTPMERAVYRLVNKDTVVEVPKDSAVIQVSLYNPDRDVAKRALALLVDHFLQRQAQIGRDPQVAFVQNQVTFYKKQVTDAQAAMEAFQLKNNISSMDEENSYLLKQRSDLEGQAAANNVRIEEDQRKSDELQKQLKTLSETVDLHQQDRDTALDAARTQLVDLQVRKQSLSTSFGPESPAVKVVQSQIDKVEDYINSYPNRAPLVQMAPNTTYQATQTALLTAQADLQAALKSRPLIQQQVDDISARLARRSQEQATYQDLVREYQVDDENYRTYLQAVQQARIAVDLNKEKGSTVAVYDPAHLASWAPTKPKRTLIILAGIAIGLLMGLTGAFLLESWDERLNTPRQVNALLGLPLLGAMTDLQRPALPRLRH